MRGKERRVADGFSRQLSNLPQSVLLFLFIFYFLRESMGGRRGKERGRLRILHRLRAQRGAQPHDPEVMT